MTREQRKIANAERPGARCARRAEDGCDGPLEVSHPFGRKIQYRWMWIWCCRRHHRGDLKNEQIGRYHCYLQGTDEDLRKFKTYELMRQEKVFLVGKYGTMKTWW